MWRWLNDVVDRSCEAIGRWLGTDELYEGSPEWTGPLGQPFPEHGPWDDLACWDPLPTARALIADIGVATWNQRSRLNVPGPFFGGETDCGIGEQVPAHILFSEDHSEFVFRQPRSPREVDDFLEAPYGEPLGGYAWDGDEHWTPGLVRAWWRERDGVREWILAELADRKDSYNDEATLREYLADLDGGALERYLRGYLFWLTEGREPVLGEELPVLEEV